LPAAAVLFLSLLLRCRYLSQPRVQLPVLGLLPLPLLLGLPLLLSQGGGIRCLALLIKLDPASARCVSGTERARAPAGTHMQEFISRSFHGNANNWDELGVKLYAG
jgi:hypothetical protein